MRENGKRSIWRKRATGVIAGVVVFATTYALILPALTLDTDRAETEPGVVLPAETTETAEIPSPEIPEIAEPEPEEETASPAEPLSAGTVDELEPEPDPAEEIGTAGPDGETVPAEAADLSAENLREDTETSENKPESPETPETDPVPEEPAEEPEETPEAPEEETAGEDPAEPESNPTADVERMADWNAMFADLVLTGDPRKDLLAAARTQIGYTESVRNFQLDENGIRRGYTRYGAWYGYPYGDWCAMFISFCLNYAGVPAAAMPREASVPWWIADLEARGMYAPAGDYAPRPGDLVFLNNDRHAGADHVGILAAIDDSDPARPILQTIEGNNCDQVLYVTYSQNDPGIVGYGVLPSAPEDTAGPADGGETVFFLEESPAYPAQTFTAVAGPVRVDVEAPEGAFPEGTRMTVTPVRAADVIEAVSGAVSGQVVGVQAVDITFTSAEGTEIEPLVPIRVSMSAAEIGSSDAHSVVHVDGDGSARVVEEKLPGQLDQLPAEDEVVFEAGDFSIYALVYTVDFFWEVDGETYEYRLPGGGFVPFGSLLKYLGAADNAVWDEAENGGDKVGRFIADIESVSFSDPDLVWVGQAETDTTLGELKTDRGLVCAYSSALTEEEIAALETTPIAAGEWALISLRPFLSEESLTITMKTHEVFTIRVTDAQIRQTVISARGETYEVTVTYGEDADIPDGAELFAAEITEEDPRYADYLTRAALAVEDENAPYEVPNGPFADGGYARFFDLEIRSEGERIEPKAPVRVDFRLLDVPEETGLTPKVVHFADAGEELMDLSVSEKEDTREDISFLTDGFSVYSVLYTVDFSFEINGKTYEFSMAGEDAVSLRELLWELHVYELPVSEETEAADGTGSPEEDPLYDPALDKLMRNIESVAFSDEELLKVCPVEEDTTLGELNIANEIVQEFTLFRPQAEVEKRNAREFAAGDWALVSLLPFDTEETLSITLKTGETFQIRVTDAQVPAMNSDGTVQTIANPAGTRIDLFDYWITDDLRNTAGRASWPGGWNGNGWNQSSTSTTGQTLRGTGNDQGINQGHALKFSPAWSGTVQNGTTGQPTVDGMQNSLNGWTGHDDVRNGWPSQGIVQSTLDENGYPVLTVNSTMGTNGESLGYLFDPQYAHNGKASYTNANHLFYVDADGYYTFESNDYNASFSGAADNGQFTLSGHTAASRPERGFWPFGQETYWTGMHMQADFSMPAGGEVLNPAGKMMPMTFEFAGDDDAWVYLDGILIGDGGGVHNITRIKIDFQTGVVEIYDDDQHRLVSSTTLKAIYEQNGVADNYRWNGDTYADFTYHTFDFFYLERGGGESNLYIKYNLVSTYDFTGHKAYEGNPREVMLRDQFRFELIGLDGQYNTAGDLVDPDGRAIMPNPVVTDPAKDPGTVGHPTLVYDEANHRQIYTTGVSEDGNINFGTASISGTEIEKADNGDPSVYRYIIREIVPDDAVNADGIAYRDASEEVRAQGGFVLDEVRYDNRIYYMTASVTSWTDQDGHVQHGLSKQYYTDDTFSELDDSTFISFTNRYTPESGSVEFYKLDSMGEALPSARFTLYLDEDCTETASDLDGVELKDHQPDPSDGRVVFENTATGVYYMKETVPEGYEPNDTVYKVVIESSRDPSRRSKIYVNGSEIETTKIINTKQGEISVIKKWIDPDGGEISGGSMSATVQLRRYHYDSGGQAVPEDHNVTVRFVFPDEVWNHEKADQTYGPVTISGSKARISWRVDGAHFYWDAEHTNRIGEGPCEVEVSLGSGDRTITIYGAEAWAANNLNACSIVPVEEDVPPPVLTPDPSFPSASDTSATQTLSAGNRWMYTWKIGNGDDCDFPATDGTNPYLYYLVELRPDGSVAAVGDTVVRDGVTLHEIRYDPGTVSGVGIQAGLITVINEVEYPKTVDIIIRKTDDAPDSEHYLDGAVFRLEYRETEDGLWTSASGIGVPQLDEDGRFTVPAAGITLTGLADGQYRLREITSPAGYVITETYPVVFEVRDGAVTTTEGTIPEVRYTAASETANASFTVPNTPGAELPRTGGTGTLRYTAGGALMVFSAAALLYRHSARRWRRDEG